MEELVELALLQQDGALVLECTNYAPFAGLIRAISGVPVFSIIDLVEFIDRSLNPPGYR